MIMIFFGDLMQQDNIAQSNFVKCPIMISLILFPVISELTTRQKVARSNLGSCSEISCWPPHLKVHVCLILVCERWP